MQNKTITVKNINRVGKSEVEFINDSLELEVYRLKGNESYRVKVGGFDKGISKLMCSEAWEWLAEYLGLTIQEEGKPVEEVNNVKKVRSQSKWD